MSQAIQMPDLCSVCGTAHPGHTFQQTVVRKIPRKGQSAQLVEEPLELPICGDCLLKHRQWKQILNIVIIVSFILGIAGVLATGIGYFFVVNLIKLGGVVMAYAAALAICLAAYYVDRWLDRRYVAPVKPNGYRFVQPAFQQAYIGANPAPAVDAAPVADEAPGEA